METRLKLIIGEHDGIQGDFGKITWKKTKDGIYTDYEQAFRELANRSSLDLADEILKKYQHPKSGARRFLFQPKEGWQDGQRGEKARSREITGTARALPDAGNRQLGSGGRTGNRDQSRRH